MTLPAPPSGSCANSTEFFALERGAADQTAVHVRHLEQLPGVGSFYAAAIEDAQLARNLSIPGRDPAADERVHGLRLLGRGGLARADRPHRLVGDHRVDEGGHAGHVEHRIELARYHLLGEIALALIERLAHAQDRREL